MVNPAPFGLFVTDKIPLRAGVPLKFARKK
jgi:hypothetical protein